jgi:Tol biopolymer transport system component
LAVSNESPSADRLDSWKEIAAYLRRDVSTVQRWERRERMPVHRHLHDKLGSVYAFKTELEAWSATRRASVEAESARPADPTHDRTSASSVRRLSSAAVVILTLAVASLAIGWRLRTIDYFWRDPLANARFVPVTDFDGTEHSATVSRDGKFVAFLSSRDGQVDVWMTQVGTERFSNLTRGRMPELVNRSVRTLEFSPDAGVLSFWVARTDAANRRHIGIWVAPTMGGEPSPFLEDVAEINWAPRGRRLVYHTPAAGDPMLVREDESRDRPIFTAPVPQHSHFPVWSPDESFIYFVQGNLPDGMDIWRIRAAGGRPERITTHNTRVSHPTFLDQSTLLYLAAADDGRGRSIYGVNLERRVPHRLTSGVERFTSLAATADGRRLVATVDRPGTSLWRVSLASMPATSTDVQKIALPTAHGRAPRFAGNGIVYVTSGGTADTVWRLTDAGARKLWTAEGARVVDNAGVSPRGDRIAFSIEERGQTKLIVVNADGTSPRVVSSAMQLRGAPAWSPDGQAIVAAAADSRTVRLFRIQLDTGAATPMLDDYSLDPVWAPNGELLVYSGMDIGTMFPLKAVDASGRPRTIPDLSLSRGARRIRFLPGRSAIAVLRGDMEHMDLWSIDLATGAETKLTDLSRDVLIADFDVSPDGRSIVFERVQENSNVVLIDRGLQ